MQLNKIKRFQFNQPQGSTTNFPSGGAGILNTVLVSDFNGFDYPNVTPFGLLAVPFKTLLRARDYLLANNLQGYTIKVLPGVYRIEDGENMDHNGVWQMEENVTVNVYIGENSRQYLFTGASPFSVYGKGTFIFFQPSGALYFPCPPTSPPVSTFEAKAVFSAEGVIGVSNYGFYGGWVTFRNVRFECLSEKNLFLNSDLDGQVMIFESCLFVNYFLDFFNYSSLHFSKCQTYGFITTPAVIIGAATLREPTRYAAVFVDCEFDVHSNYTGCVWLKTTGVKLCIGRSRFIRGDENRYSIKNDFENTVAISAISTAPIIGKDLLINVYGPQGIQYIDPNLLPYLLTI